MHHKSFTFGLGVGILAVTLIVYLLYNFLGVFENSEYTQEQVMALASELGLELVLPEEENDIPFLQSPPEVTEAPEIEELELPTEIDDIPSEDEGFREEIIMSENVETPVPTQPLVTVPPATVAPATVAPAAAITVAPAPVMPVETVTPTGVSINIPYATPAVTISDILHQNNIIDDPVGFTQYLIQIGYTQRLRAGTTEFQPNSTFEEVLEILTRQRSH